MKKRILSTLLALCMVLALLPGTALAATVASGKCGTNATWTLDSGGTLTISGTGEMGNYSNPDKKTPWWEKRFDIYTVVIKKGITAIGTGAFEACMRMGSVTIPDSVTSIKRSAFFSCEKLNSITIPDSVTSIGNYAFMCCDSLMTVKVPASVTKIGVGAFDSCERLSAIVVDRANSGYTAIDGVLFTKNMKQIMAYPAGKSGSSYVIPGGVTSIGDDAFYGCHNLSSVTIPAGVTSIGNRAFGSYDSNLRSVTIPNSVTFIGNGAFGDCYGLKDVYYSGTEAQWREINIVNAATMNGPLLKAKIHYNSNSGTSLAKPTVKVSPTTVTEGTTVTATWNAISGATKYHADLWNTDKPDMMQVAAAEILGPITGGAPAPKFVIDQKLTPGHYRIDIYAGDYNGNKSEIGSATFTVTKKSVSAKTYTIKLDANSGKVSPSSIKVDSGKTYLSSLPTPTRTGYKFDGWYTEKTGGTKITSTTKATANRTIFARWTKSLRTKTYTVSFDTNGGTVDSDQKTVRIGSLYGALPTPVRNYFYFQGWYTKKTGGVKVTENTRVNLSTNQTLYAHWQRTGSVKNTQQGTYRVTVPAYYDLALYTTNISAQMASRTETNGYQTITCTQKATLSNGTVRYYGKVNNRNYWFTYSCEMDVK